MTLKEKFNNVEIMFEGQTCYIKYDELCKASNQCEQISYDFAIGFAEWIENYAYHKKYNVWIKNDSLTVGKTTTKQLLEIYKKEKEL